MAAKEADTDPEVRMMDPEDSEDEKNPGEGENDIAAEGTDQGEGVDGADDLTADRDAAKQEAKESYDRFLRASAEFENYKKRATRDMDEFRKYANESLIRELLPVVDNLERALQSSAESNAVSDTENLTAGVDMTLKEILKVFEKFVIKPIDALGQRFDPTFHQAVMQEENDNEPENTILRELQKGYKIHDRLLRPSMVVVSRSSKQASDKSASEPQDNDEDTSTP
ncbi:MAG: nucleotide exchange factor GrpE [Desulfobacterales bacterium]